MRTHLTAVLVAVAFGLRPGPRCAAAEEPAGEDRLRALVWAAADAPAERYAEALRALEAEPGASWRVVHDLLALGRSYPAKIEEPAAASDEEFRAYFGRFRFVPGKVVPYDLGEGWRHWYSFRLPRGWDGRTPLATVLCLGGVVPGGPGGDPPDGVAVVTLDPRITTSATLGGAPISMTGGTAFQSIVLSVVADLERRYPADRDRVFVAGYSRAGNATWYFGLHWPALWAGIAPASGYYVCDDSVVGNLLGLPVLAARGGDDGHKGANEFTATFVERLTRLRHGAVTLWTPPGATDGAAGPEFEAALVSWAAGVRREALPDTVTYARLDPNHHGAAWLDIEEPKDAGGTQTVVIRNAAGEEHERLTLQRKASSVRARVTAPNEVELRLTNVASLRLLLSPARFDLDRTVKVRTGSRTLSFEPRPAISVLLDRFRRDRDRRRLFAAELVVRP